MLSVRIETSKQSKGQNGHDHGNRPSYADPDRKHLNKTIFGGSELAINEKIKSQSKYVIGAYNANSDAKREAANSPEERKKIGSWRKTTATHKKAILSFSSEVRADQQNIDRDELDQCALNFFNDLCAKNNCELTYIVRHDDETTPHYHAMFTNFNSHEMKPLKFQMGDLSRIQDQAGEAFSSMGISRGIRRGDRIDIAKTNNPRYENEDLKDYNKRIYKIANVVHRTVAKLKDDLPKEIAEKEDEVNRLVDQINEQHDEITEQALIIDEQALSLRGLNIENTNLKNEIEKMLGEYKSQKSLVSAELYAKQLELAEAKKVISQQGDIVNSLKLEIVKIQEEQQTQNNRYLKNKAYLEKAEAKLGTLNDECIAVENKINKNMGIYKNREQDALRKIEFCNNEIEIKKKILSKIIADGQRHMKQNAQAIEYRASIGRDTYLEQFEELKAQAKPNIDKINRLEEENAFLRDQLERNTEYSRDFQPR